MDYIEDRITDPACPIECVWELRGDGREPQRIATDARAEIIVQRGADCEQWDGSGWNVQPRSLFSGQITRPLMIRPTGEVHTVGIRLKTWATGLGCGADAATVTDRIFSLGNMDLGSINGKLAERCRTIARQPRAERLRAAAELFAGRVPRFNAPPEQLRFAVMQAESTCGDARVAAWARASNMSLRTFERHLAATVGVGPKMLLRMLRFRAAAKLVEQRAPAAGIAARLGYSDQSHLHKDFLRFAGSGPSGFAAAETEMAMHFLRNA